jgi:hypothetical protein
MLVPMKVVLYGHNFSGDEAVQKKELFWADRRYLQAATGDIAPRKKNKGNFVENYKYAVGGISVTPMKVRKVIMFWVWVNTLCVLWLASSISDFRDNFGIKVVLFITSMYSVTVEYFLIYWKRQWVISLPCCQTNDCFQLVLFWSFS